MPKTLRENAATFLGAAGPLLLTGHWLAAILNLLLYVYLVWLDKNRFEIRTDGLLYLTRFHLQRLIRPYPFLHRIHLPDAGRDLHNHPWPTGWTFVLWGGYVEKYTLDMGKTWSWRVRRRWRLYRLEPELYHRIVSVDPHTLTLFFAGKRSRDWGFLVNGEHMPCRKYLGLPEDHDFGD